MNAVLVIFAFAALAGFGGLAILVGLNTRLSLKAERMMRQWLRRRASTRDERQARNEIAQQVAFLGFNLRKHCRDRQVVAHR